jgi:catechol 2,3-dioxygenase-like lactoylglutathione lyase family enzyme
MKRLHVSVNVDSLDKAVSFYSALFGAAPDVLKDDYARWRLDEPSVNFATTARGRKLGVDHMGIDVDDPAELDEVTQRLADAGHAASDLTDGACCYHRSTKSWSVDPGGVAWETFHTYGRSATYGTDAIDETSIARVAEGSEMPYAPKPPKPPEACC